MTISSKAPHFIEDATRDFTETFAKPGVQVVGRTLRTIFGPRTDSSEHFLYPALDAGRLVFRQ